MGITTRTMSTIIHNTFMITFLLIKKNLYLLIQYFVRLFRKHIMTKQKWCHLSDLKLIWEKCISLQIFNWECGLQLWCQPQKICKLCLWLKISSTTDRHNIFHINKDQSSSNNYFYVDNNLSFCVMKMNLILIIETEVNLFNTPTSTRFIIQSQNKNLIKIM